MGYNLLRNFHLQLPSWPCLGQLEGHYAAMDTLRQDIGVRMSANRDLGIDRTRPSNANHLVCPCAPRSAPLKTSKFIALAEDEITKGWCRHATEDEHGNVDMVGAYQRVWAHHYHRCSGWQLYKALTLTAAMIAKLGLGQLCDLFPERVIDIFNDHRAKNKDEVLAVMGKTRLHCVEAGD